MSAAASGVGRDQLARTPAPALSTRQRRPGWVALALTLIVGAGMLGGYAYQQAGAKTSVVVMRSTVPAGHPITRADLSVVSIAGPLATIADDDLDQVVGRRAKVTLMAGTPVQASMLSPAGATTDQAQVGLAVAAGQYPADGVRVGDTVTLLHSPGASSGQEQQGQPAQILVQAAAVWSSRSDPTRSGGLLLTVTVPVTIVGDVVAASSSGQVAVVRMDTAS
jgi:hypothetical protein